MTGELNQPADTGRSHDLCFLTSDLRPLIMTSTVAELCRDHNIDFAQFVERSGLEENRAKAIILGRWTPSPEERRKVCSVFGVEPQDVTWGHATPIQHIWGHGPG